ncbi:formate acetyltransferase, partial [Pseudoxanthomonas sp. SGD-10]
MKAEVTNIPFVPGAWNTTINVYDFVAKNIKPYYGDASFLSGPSQKTVRLWDACKQALLKERKNNGCLAIDTETISTMTAFAPGYIKQEDEVIVGLQTDQLLKRAMKPFGGIKLVESAVRERGLEVSERVKDIFNYAKSHNDAVFSAYDAEIRAFRSKHVLTGLPDNYARGRIIGDFRRLPLYGADALINFKKADFNKVGGE